MKRKCLIGKALSDVTGEHLVALERLVTTPVAERGLSADDLSAVLYESGIPASATTIKLHRRGKCMCEREIS